MNRKNMNRKWIKTALAGLSLQALAFLPLMATPPEGPDTVALGPEVIRELRMLVYILIGIALLVGYIVLLLTVKDPSKMSIKWFWDNLRGTNAADPVMEHEYDGIRELDNPMPAWLKLLFYGTIGFAFVYILHYHFLGTGVLQREEYENEMALAAEMYKSVELPEDALVLITDASRLKGAKTFFNENCATCHGEKLEGLSGPNLTDEYWLHGADVKGVYATITNGVPGKTMISWKDKIPSQQRLELASYILSLQGSNPPNAKEPEGVIGGTSVEEPAPAADSSATEIPADSLAGDSLE